MYSALASASVWEKTLLNNFTTFRIGSNELSSDGYVRSHYDKDVFVVLLSRSDSKLCPAGSCTLQLSTNERIEDGNILHQENIFGTPFGFKNVFQNEPLYCARVDGDCGADVPIYRFTNISGLKTSYAYSLDAKAKIPGFVRELSPMCYGWSDGGSQKVANSLRVTGCQRLPNVSNGEIEYQSSSADTLPLGTRAFLNCTNGYATTGPTELTCSQTGWHPIPAFDFCKSQISPKRLEARCWALPSPMNGRIAYSKQGIGVYKEGTLAHIYCYEGYAPSNPIKQAKCDRNGQWTTEDLGTCEQLCRDLPPIPNGKITYMKKRNKHITVGSTALLRCSSGYKIIGLDSVTCEASGWAPFPGIGSCVSVGNHCLFGLPIVLGGSISYTQGGIFGPFPSGTVAKLICSPGLTVNGVAEATCSGTTWDPPAVGSCLPSPNIVKTEVPKRFTTTTGTGESTSSKARGVGTVEGIAPMSVTSTTPTQATAINLTNELCLLGLPKPTDGSLIYSQGGIFGPYPPGTIATLKCESGFSKEGETSVCHNGQWNPPSFTPCTKDIHFSGVRTEASPIVECLGGIPRPLHGYVTYSNGQTLGPFPSGTIATITCNAGYLPTGITTSSCQSGIWSPATFAQCIPGGDTGLGFGGTDGLDSCGAGLPTPLNGQVNYSDLSIVGPYPSGTTATLICNLGYTPSGAVTTVCQNGLWSPAFLGDCVLGATGGLGTETLGTAYCPTGLATPLNGIISYSSGLLPPYASGTMATVICNLGYSASGTLTSTCRNGAWYPSTPAQCVLGLGGGGAAGAVGQCGPLTGSINGEVTYLPMSLTTTYNSGTIATLNCNLGYISSGQTTATCMNGIWQPSLLGSCVPGIGGGGIMTGQCLFALPAVLNGNIQYSAGGTIGPYNDGTSATLTCNIGYLPSGGVTSLCTNGIWEPPTLGLCTPTGQLGDLTSNLCRPIPNIDNGQIHFSRKASKGFYRAGTLAALHCHKTYPLTGRFSVCQNGTWNPPLGSCDENVEKLTGPNSCSKLSVPVNAKIFYIQASLTNSYEVGTSAVLSCNSGYVIKGHAMLTCTVGGWEPKSGLGECTFGQKT